MCWHRSEPPIGRFRMPCGGARLMLQAAKHAGVAALDRLSFSLSCPAVPRVHLVIPILSALSMKSLARYFLDSVSDSVTRS